jgi:hypothetical protein
MRQGSEAGSINLETSDNTMFCIAQVVSSALATNVHRVGWHTAVIASTLDLV